MEEQVLYVIDFSVGSEDLSWSESWKLLLGLFPVILDIVLG
tara:strand:- start:656 stop:778 length:123 start_codon:yes stop_codon:yes gene_type:complete